MDRYNYGMDRNRGPSGNYGSRIPPPIYSVEERERERDRDLRRSEVNDYRSSRKYAPPAETISSDSSDGYTVEEPQDSSTRAWLIVLSCAVLHACSELTYFLFFNTTLVGPLRNVRLVLESKTPVSTYTDFRVFADVRIAGEFFVALCSLLIGYRWTAIIGSVCTLGGFLGASFVTDIPEHIELMGFLVGFLGGIGCASWRFAAYVAVMEYFKKTRMVALIVSGLGRIVGIFIGYGILAIPLRLVIETDSAIGDIESMTEWHIYYKCVCAPACVALLVSMTLTPLPICTIRGRSLYGFKALKHRTWNVLSSGFFWLTLCIYFFYYLGESLPNVYIVPMMLYDQFVSRFILAAIFTLACGTTLGYVLLAFWPKKNRFYNTFIASGCLCMVLGLLALQLPVFKNYHFSYVGAYVALHGLMQVVFETLIRYVIPIAFSRQYIWLAEGMLGLFGGGGIIVGNFVATELVDADSNGIANVFYFAGSALLTAGLLAVVTCNLMRCLHVSDKNYEKEIPVRRQRKPYQHDNSHYSDGRRRRGDEFELGGYVR